MRAALLSLILISLSGTDAFSKSRIETDTQIQNSRSNYQEVPGSFDPVESREKMLELLYSIPESFDTRNPDQRDNRVSKLIEEVEALDDYSTTSVLRSKWLWNKYVVLGTAVVTVYTVAYLTGYAPSPWAIASVIYQIVHTIVDTAYGLASAAYSQYNLWLAPSEQVVENFVQSESINSTSVELLTSGTKEAVKSLVNKDVGQAAAKVSKALTESSIKSVIEHEADWGPAVEILPQARANTVIIGVLTYLLASNGIGNF